MAKKKKSQQPVATTNGTGPDSTSTSAAPPKPSSKTPSSQRPPEPSTSALIICRNKHWRYISSFHGPWLQLPVDVLESLANTNYMSPRPLPIDPAVFYDLVKIRKAVDEATNLAVRATSGLTSAAMSNSLHAGNGMLGGAAALGLGFGGGGGVGNARLSRERKHRMRELATLKLSQAYHLDEIASSVATMQSASTLEDVAQLVLQRNPTDVDAKYVHFFHEKIPSRMLAEYTPLDTLNDIVTERPMDGSPLRTRALSRIFKDDYVGAARDLTDSLAACRYMQAQHRAGKDQLVLAKAAAAQHPRDWRQEVKVAEEDQPSSLEAQVLFHRAGVYFAIACQHVHTSLDGFKDVDRPIPGETTERDPDSKQEILYGNAEQDSSLPLPFTLEEKEVRRKCLEARKIVKTNARRALRDYIAFLSHVEYTPGLSPAMAEEVLWRLQQGVNGWNGANGSGNSSRQTQTTTNGSSRPPQSDALVPREEQQSHSGSPYDRIPQLALPEVYQVATLFSSSPPSDLPPYPSTQSASPHSAASRAASALVEFQEAVTYHPLLTDALHSLLLCHALLQTPTKELQRHAYNAARIARVCDGYPVFLAARSPARADWIELLRRTGNWIGLVKSWESLCQPAPLPSAIPSHQQAAGSSSRSIDATGSSASDLAKPFTSLASTSTSSRSVVQQCKETETQKQEGKHEQILDALVNEHVVDKESLQLDVQARQNGVKDDKAAKEAATSDAVTSSRITNGSIPPAVAPLLASSQALATANTSTASPVSPVSRSTSSISNPASTSTSFASVTTTSASLPQPKRWAQEDGREYPVSTERAEAISRWVREAPLTIEGAGGGSSSSSKAKRDRARKSRAAAANQAQEAVQAGNLLNGSGGARECDGDTVGDCAEQAMDRLRVDVEEEVVD